MATKAIFINNDTLFKLSGLKDGAAGGSFLNAGTVSVTIYDDQGVQVPGISWPVTMAFVASSNGDYEGAVDKAIQLVAGQQYVARITAVEGTINGEWDINLFADLRE